MLLVVRCWLLVVGSCFLFLILVVGFWLLGFVGWLLIVVSYFLFVVFLCVVVFFSFFLFIVFFAVLCLRVGVSCWLLVVSC